MGDKKKRVHIISHSHWDREWYMPLERHKMKLVDLIDANMELFEKDPDFKCFHLDGQTIVLDDYLEVRPDRREQVEKYIREGRFKVGPFYILQDEFLTSSEANVRNLQTGMREAQKYGNLTRIGYFPDAFGNVGQAPQLLLQAGMEAVAFGRGVRTVGFDNGLKETGEYESNYSEMLWESPDGSALLGILFAGWYNNGMEIPVEEEAARAYWDKRLESALRFASTDELLFLNGCDHQPVQKDLAAAIETARRLYPDVEFIHSDFETYVRCVKKAAKHALSRVRGELTSQETDGWYTLVNTCSSHVYLKRLNRMGEVALERLAEPLCAFAQQENKAYPHDRLNYAWKILMQNHPHDSICGCSVDQVNKEMEIRFDRSREVAHTIIESASGWLADKVDTSGFAAYGEDCVPFVVFNTTGWERTGSVTLTLEVRRDRDRWLAEGYQNLEKWPLPACRVVDAKGNEVEAVVKDAGIRFGYDLPDDRFRQPYMARLAEVTIYARAIPACGYAVYGLVLEAPRIRRTESLVTGKNRMENDALAVQINEDGTLCVRDKVLNREYKDICYFEDTLDAGNEYIYFCPEGNPAILSKGKTARVSLVEDTSFRAVYEVEVTLQVPVSADEQLQKEQESLVEFMHRTCRRSRETTALTLHTFYTLEREGRSIQCRTELDNKARDHRLRLIVPTGLACSYHYAESVFEAVKRPNEHSRHWQNPCKCEHQQGFVSMQDERGGLMINNIGLYEYEILPKQDNAIAVTLLRCVGELGDWGVFPTQLSQQQRPITAEYELSFFSGDMIEVEGYRQTQRFQTPTVALQTGLHSGSLETVKSFLSWHGAGLSLSNIKVKDGGRDWMVRFVNFSGHDSVLYLKKDASVARAYLSNVVEEEKETLCVNGSEEYALPVKAYEIVTVGLEKM